MKRDYFMTVVDGVFCLGMRVIIKPEPRFNRHAMTGVKLWAVITLQSLW